MTAEQTPDTEIGAAGRASLCLSFFERAPWPMAATEGASHIVRCANPAFCRLLDQPLEQLVGKPFCELLPEKDECAVFLDRVYRTRQPESHTEEQYSAPHPLFWSYTMWPVMAQERLAGVMIQVTETAQFHESMIAMNEELARGSVRQHALTEAAESANALLLVEISERQQAEESLRRAQAQLTDRAKQLAGLVAERTAELSATNKQLETFVYSIAHDLRAPLRAMQGFSSMLVEEAGASLNETSKEHAARISQSAQFMDALLMDLLAFNRISQQRVELTPVSLQTVVESVLSRLQKDIQEKNALVDSSGPWPVVLAHEPTLAQVLFNLLGNALKFTTPEVPPRVRLRAEEQAEFIRVWVEDNGPGIAADHQGKIFRLFTRLEGEKYEGTGIGLAIVQKGVERMGGRVGVKSIPGQGSRLWFELRAGR
jgi:signal transduction histidine kinase